MEVKIVTSREMGVNCWLPQRFLKSCFKCLKYSRCKYPERVVNPRFDILMDKRRAITEEIDMLLKRGGKR